MIIPNLIGVIERMRDESFGAIARWVSDYGRMSKSYTFFVLSINQLSSRYATSRVASC